MSVVLGCLLFRELLYTGTRFYLPGIFYWKFQAPIAIIVELEREFERSQFQLFALFQRFSTSFCANFEFLFFPSIKVIIMQLNFDRNCIILSKLLIVIV